MQVSFSDCQAMLSFLDILHTGILSQGYTSLQSLVKCHALIDMTNPFAVC